MLHFVQTINSDMWLMDPCADTLHSFGRIHAVVYAILLNKASSSVEEQVWLITCTAADYKGRAGVQALMRRSSLQPRGHMSKIGPFWQKVCLCITLHQ